MRQSITPSGENPKVGLALGAGGIKGWAHVGVLKVLHEETVPVDLIVGASAGALMGPLYAARRDAEDMERTALSFSLHDFTQWFLRGLSLAPNGGPMSARLWQTYGRLTFDELAVPFAAVAHDVGTGSRLVLREGLVATAVEASIRPPFFGPPTSWNGHVLLDGGFQMAVPTDVARELGASMVIGVNLGVFLRLPAPLRPYSAMLGRALRREQPLPHSLRGQMAFVAELLARGRTTGSRPDIEIKPELAGISAFAPWHITLAIKRGEQAARAALPAIHRLLAQVVR